MLFIVVTPFVDVVVVEGKLPDPSAGVEEEVGRPVRPADTRERGLRIFVPDDWTTFFTVTFCGDSFNTG